MAIIKIFFQTKYIFCSDRKYFCNFKMMSTAFIDVFSTCNVREMKVLDRSKFNFVKKVPTISIKDCHVSIAMKYIKKYLLKVMNFKPVQIADNEDSITLDNKIKNIYLNPICVSQWSDLNISDRKSLENLGITEKCFCLHEIQLSYENWKCEDILKAILPADKENLTSFSKIGHIVHVNLRDHHLEYKHIIGEVLLDKVKESKTVVNKINSIDNTYRNFSMELLCGIENYLTLVKENGFLYEFDFSKVYWNPRLSTEHGRITNLLKTGDYLFDVFAGVGPFSIPASKKKCLVYANDLNPESFKWLKHNAKLNKILETNFHPYNYDGRDFLIQVFRHFLINSTEGLDDKCTIHLTMNLPAIAVEFLSVFRGLLKDIPSKNTDKLKEPIVHVYCFAVGDSPVEIAKNMVESNLGISLSGEQLVEIFNVRNVSPKKEMMRVSFKLPRELMFKIDDKNFQEKSSCVKRSTADENEFEPQEKSLKLR